MQRTCMKKDGNLSRSYVDSFGLPRAVFGRMIGMSDPMAEAAVDLEGALPTAICMTSWNDDRVAQVTARLVLLSLEPLHKTP